MKKFPQDPGKVGFACGSEINFSSGLKLRPGDRVHLWDKRIGTVDYIRMEFFPNALHAEIVLRIVEDNGQGNQFRYPVEG